MIFQDCTVTTGTREPSYSLSSVEIDGYAVIALLEANPKAKAVGCGRRGAMRESGSGKEGMVARVFPIFKIGRNGVSDAVVSSRGHCTRTCTRGGATALVQLQEKTPDHRGQV